MLLRDWINHLRRQRGLEPISWEGIEGPRQSRKGWYGETRILPPPALKFELFLIGTGDVLLGGLDGFEQTPNGRLHVLWPGSHKHSNNSGETWQNNAALSLPVPSLPGSTGSFYTEADRPCPFFNVAQYEIDNAVCLSTSSASSISHTFDVVTQSIESRSFCATPDGRLHAFYRFAYFRDTFFESWGCVNIHIVGTGRNPDTGICSTPVNPPILLGTFTIGGPSNARTYSERQRFMLYTKTGTDGLAWDGSMITVESTFASDPDGQGGTFQESGSSGLSAGFEIKAASDGSLHLIWIFDGYVGGSQISADLVKECRYRAGPSGSTEVVAQQNGAAWLWRPSFPRVTRDPTTGKTMAMYRSIENPFDKTRYRIRASGGGWGTEQVFFTGSSGNITGHWKLFESAAKRARVLFTVFPATGLDVYDREFDFETEAWLAALRLRARSVEVASEVSGSNRSQGLEMWMTEGPSSALPTVRDLLFVGTVSTKKFKENDNYALINRSSTFLQTDVIMVGALPSIVVFGGKMYFYGIFGRLLGLTNNQVYCGRLSGLK